MFLSSNLISSLNLVFISVSSSSTNGSSTKYTALFQFGATREDELSIQQGDTMNVNLSVKSDEDRAGVFPIAFAASSNEFEQTTSANSELPPVAVSGKAVAKPQRKSNRL